MLQNVRAAYISYYPDLAAPGALVGVAVYALYLPHGTVAAGVVVIAAGVYEFTPLKRYFRRRCRDTIRSGFRFGLCCAGSSIGLMAMLLALGVMSVTWMAVTAILVLAQKLLPPEPPSMCRWRWPSRGLASGSSSRPPRFPGSRHRCETSPTARAGPS